MTGTSGAHTSSTRRWAILSEPLRWLYMLPRPKVAVFLDVPVEKSLDVIGSRPDHIRYGREVLAEERKEYLSIAKETGFPVIDATREFQAVQREIEAVLGEPFPSKPVREGIESRSKRLRGPSLQESLGPAKEHSARTPCRRSL